MKYSIYTLTKNALSNHELWPVAWRTRSLKPQYDVVIIGGGGHGLATAYYLAKKFNIKNIAVLERGWLGGGNTGRNTTIVRSNYILPSNALLYEESMKLWEELSIELNYNVMYSPRGVLNLGHSTGEMEALARRGNMMRMRGIDAELLTTRQVKQLVPPIDCSFDARFPIEGGLLQPRGGTVRHDAVAWGYARAADKLGVDIIQECEVTGIPLKNGSIKGVETTKGFVSTSKIGVAVAGYSSAVAKMIGINLPIESHLLQAMVTEPLKPVLHHVVASAAVHFYISQSDKGELVIGGDLDSYNSYAQRGNLPPIRDALKGCLAIFPSFSRLKLMRTWGGVVDMTMDGSPIIDKLIDGVTMTGGWCYGGFKATPISGWLHAHLIANDKPHPLSVPFSLGRFRKGKVLDERGAGPYPWLH